MALSPLKLTLFYTFTTNMASKLKDMQT